MKPIGHNLELAHLMLNEMESYLLSEQLFWPMRGRGSLPRLTTGGLLMIMDELAAQEAVMNAAELEEWVKAGRELDRLAAAWRVAMNTKVRQEISTRLNLWQSYLRDLEERKVDPGLYPHEVRARVMIDRLVGRCLQGALDSALQDRLQALDSQLRRVFQPGEFVWDDRLMAMYPQPAYWFLYGRPRRRPAD
jgi:hypothetical protein